MAEALRSDHLIAFCGMSTHRRREKQGQQPEPRQKKTEEHDRRHDARERPSPPHQRPLARPRPGSRLMPTTISFLGVRTLPTSAFRTSLGPVLSERLSTRSIL